MLIIQNSQIAQFQKSLQEPVAADIFYDLRTDHTEDVEVLDDNELRDLIDEGLEKADAHGFKLSTDIATFVKLLFIVGWHFDSYELFEFYLTDKNCAPSERLDYIFEVADDEDWQAAAEYSREIVRGNS